jgi:hypothetical protein
MSNARAIDDDGEAPAPCDFVATIVRARGSRAHVRPARYLRVPISPRSYRR